MNNLNKVTVPIAVSKKSKIDLPSTHITTGDFFLNKPVHYHHMIPGETYKCPFVNFTRLEPLSVPVYGNIRQNIRAFFVPYRVVMRNWDDFKMDTFAFNTDANTCALVNAPKFIQNGTLYNLVTTVGNGYCVAGTSSDFDFEDGTNFYKLTTKGRYALTILESLGYKIIKPAKTAKNQNALALLAFVRIWFDWYANTQYADSATYLKMKELLEETGNAIVISYLDLLAIFNAVLFVGYDHDYFVDAWDSPSSPNDILSSQYSISDFTNSYTLTPNLVEYNTGNWLQFGDANSPAILNGDDVVNITKYSLEALESLSSYLKRFQLAGAKAADRALAQLGISVKAENLNRSQYLGMQEVTLKIGDVMSHAGTSDNKLGDYAGQGSGGTQGYFEYQSDEYGIFIVTTSLIPEYGYYQGVDRHNLHMDKLDFWTPEFDQLGVQAIAKGELAVFDDLGWADDDGYWQTFGYSPRYAEYKTSRNFVTGMYRLPRLLAGGDAWHLQRKISATDFASGHIDSMVHNLVFTLGAYDYEEYDRIFDYTEEDFDHFNMYFFFGGSSYSPACSLFDSFDFHEENDNKQVTMSPAGAKLN